MKLICSFHYALNGLRYFFGSDRNGKIELGCALSVIALGYIFRVSKLEWCLITVCIGMVLALEMFNTAIEKMADIVQPEYSTPVKIVKDVAAGAVMLAAAGSLIIGLIVFVPKILNA